MNSVKFKKIIKGCALWGYFNSAMWIGEELGSLGPDDGIKNKSVAIAKGIGKGITCFLFPPISFYYFFEMMKNLDFDTRDAEW
jgi:hypothetical protein